MNITFLYPTLLLALLALPLLWWLLRLTPPPARREVFPALRLLLGLRTDEQTPAGTPWWLLALRMLAAALVIVGLARPVIDSGSALPGSGPVLAVVDNGWASSRNWQARIATLDALLLRAERDGRQVALLATAPSARNEAPRVLPLMSAAEARTWLAALQPLPWAPDRNAAMNALRDWQHPDSTILYLADGVRHDAVFGDALAEAGNVTEIRDDTRSTLVQLPPQMNAGRLVARVSRTPAIQTETVAVLARTGDGRTLARSEITLASGATQGSAAIDLPPELRNKLLRLDIENSASAASTVLLDERWRRRPVGLLASSDESADTPLLGDLYYLERALSPAAEIRRGSLQDLLARDIAIIALADRAIPDGPELDALTRWVEKGGMLLRFAGPRSADMRDALLPIPLRRGDRQLGGAMSWSQPARLAPFAAASPFAGLTLPDDIRIERQLLAEPAPLLAERTWAALEDGTPLVTSATRGAGRVVLFHVTANADWSNLPLSGLFLSMLERLVQISAGIAGADGDAMLAPANILDGFGHLAPPPPAAASLRADAFGSTAVSPQHPPGLYGPEAMRRALNLSTTFSALESASPISGARQMGVDASPTERSFAQYLLLAALLLLLTDMLIALSLRGLLRVAVLLLCVSPAHAQQDALATHLAYVITGNAEVDATSRAGLVGLSGFVNQRTSAVLAEPVGVVPGRDGLEFYPLLYWPITAQQPALDAKTTEAVSSFMRNGGIILFDTRLPTADTTPLRRVTQRLAIPPLARLTGEHVLARSFYLLTAFPGQFADSDIWVSRDADRENDSISPVIIGGNNWAAAWARGEQLTTPFFAQRYGPDQQTLALRFGLNLVMYALTGNYKGDQVHLPALMERLGN